MSDKCDLCYEEILMQCSCTIHSTVDQPEQPTLRDQFAMAALTGCNVDGVSPNMCAKWCYEIADAMMEARK